MSVFPGASVTRDLGELRKLPLIIALALILICVALELGAAGFLHTAGNTAEAVQNVQNSSVFKDMTPAQQQRTIQSVQNAAGQDDPPGLGIPYLALVDGILAYSLARLVLALVLPINIESSICVVVATQRYRKDIGLILMILTSFIATIIVSFLHGLVPGPIVSITDALAAIIVGIIALIWAIVVLIGSIIATVFALTTKGAEVPEVTSSSPPAQS